MKNVSELVVSKPVAVWNKDISLEPKKFLLGISKMVVKGVFQDWSDCSEAALDSLDALGLRDKPGELELSSL